MPLTSLACLILLQVGNVPLAQERAAPAPDPPAPVGPVPSDRQLAWSERELYGFVHFGMNTFTGSEWGSGEESPSQFAPTALDCGQWAQVAKDAGLDGLILTAKHHDGFCLWPSRLTDHTVASSAWRDGAGDVLAEFAAACRAADLDWGVYVSPWDRNAETWGQGAAYDAFYRGQLAEVLGYGPVFEVWFDGALGDTHGVRQDYDWESYVELVRELQPMVVVFGTTQPDVRWIGNESGVAGSTNWSPFRLRDHRPGANDPGTLQTGHADGTHWVPAECDVSIRPGWFHHAAEDDAVKTPEELVELYLASVGRNAALLLNVPPDRRGRFHENDVASLMGMRALLDATFESDLARGVGVKASNVRGNDETYRAKNVVDGDPDTYWATDDGVHRATLEIDLGVPLSFNLILLEEYVRLGQRVEKFSVQAYVDNDWREIAVGTTIGAKRILPIEPVSARRLRVLFTDSRGPLAIATVGLHLSPPVVAIDPPGGWILAGEPVEVTLSSDLPEAEIHYTLDGSEPTRGSARYSAPLRIERATRLSARAFYERWQTVHPPSVRFDPWRGSTLDVPVEFALAPDPGLRWTAFEGEWSSLAEVPWSMAKARGFSAGFELDGRTRDQGIALRFDGYLAAPATGVYTFDVTATDACRMFLADELVVDAVGPRPASGSIALAAGWHPLRLDFLNASGAPSLAVDWSGPGGASGPLAPTALAH